MGLTVITEPSAADLARRGAAIFSRMAVHCVELRGCFVVALSGGATPRPMHRILSEAPYLTEMPWDRTHLFWADERCVPVNDPASNYAAARADFLGRVAVPEDQVHPMPVDFPPEEGAALYQEELLHFFQPDPFEVPVFDLVCLGIGADGHTASLFPGQSALSETKRLIVSGAGGSPPVGRLTMTLPLINNAREIVFHVSGKDKAPIIKAILEGTPGRFPAQMIRPVHGNLTWLLDREAASLVNL